MTRKHPNAGYVYGNPELVMIAHVQSWRYCKSATHSNMYQRAYEVFIYEVNVNNTPATNSFSLPHLQGQ